jgi:C-terminal processing protease CtpA/Prc
MRAFILSVLLLLFSISVLAQSTYIESSYSADKLNKDFEILSSSIINNHPGTFIYKSEEEWRNFLKVKKREIKEGMNETEFLKLIMSITNEIKCGHTNASYSKKFIKTNLKRKHHFLPFSVWINDGKIRLSKFTRKDSAALLYNAELFSINQIPADSIYKTLLSVPSKDGFASRSNFTYVNLLFKPYFRRYFGEKDTFTIAYKNQKQEVINVKLKSQNETTPQPNFEDYFFKRSDKVVFSSMGSDFLMMDTLGLNIPVIKLRSFSSMYNSFYKSIFEYLEYFNLKMLVIDLRYNGGGSLANAAKLLSYLLPDNANIIYEKSNKPLSNKQYYSQKLARWITPYVFKKNFNKKILGDKIIYEHLVQYKSKNHFKGKVFVLTNGGTFSASCIVSAYLKDQTDATIIGEETGGTESGCNAILLPRLTLPNTGINVIMPMYRVKHQLKNIEFGKGIIPKIKTSYSALDIINKKDLDWLEILKLLKPSEFN